MLILARREGDAILIGGEGGIRIVLLECDRRVARIGIEAPPEMSIVREEIVVEIAEENQRATVGDEALAGLPLVSAVPRATES